MKYITLFIALALALPALGGKPGESPGRKYTTIERMTVERLEAVHKDVEKLKAARKEVSLKSGLNDYRAIMHTHAEDSAHTGGTLPEVLRDAKRVDVDIIFLSDHFRPPRDFIEGRWRGLKEGVLFIPGSETHGYLIHPENSILDKMEGEREELIAAVSAGDGLIFLSHVESKRDWSLAGLTGMEIYNRHADAMDDAESMRALVGGLTDPEQYAALKAGLERFPAEFLGSQQDYLTVYADKWDSALKEGRVVGIAADDCHHNQVYAARMVDGDTVDVGSMIDLEKPGSEEGDDLTRVTVAQSPNLGALTAGHQPGDIVSKIDIDPYYIFFHNVSTHVLADELSEPTVRKAVKAGHAYVSHDWLCDPKGFVFGVAGKDDGLTAIMGDELTFAEGSRLIAEMPSDCEYRLLRDGEVILEGTGRTMSYPIDGPGVYRFEAWLTVDDEKRPWIYANPVYIR